MARVKLDSIRKVHDNGFVAVHGLDLDVRDGEFVVLVGPSGCGKSTTLRIIAGLETLSSGELWIGDRMVNDLAPRERDIAMVFQSYALYPHMTVGENMGFALKVRKLPKREIQQRVREAAELLGIVDILDRRPKQLSGGQRQRAAIGRAIVRQPQVFLFDEPLSNLDAKLRVQMRKEISHLHRRLGNTAIYVTHDQVEAMTMGDRIVVMNAGRAEQIDSPLALYQHPRTRFVAGFIGSPTMNFFEGTLVRANGRDVRFRAASSAFDLALSEQLRSRLEEYEGRRVTAGVRPEHVLPVPAGATLPPDSSASFQLDLVEPLGSEMLVHAHLDAHEVTARIAPRPLPALGDPVTLAFDIDRMHVFDAETTEAILTER
ncbi:MAG: ABC transporter ATP-binding protein [Gemmatimonadaceae bacterium]